MAARLKLCLGTKFYDYQTLNEAIKEYEAANFVCTYIRSSRSISSYQNRGKLMSNLNLQKWTSHVFMGAGSSKPSAIKGQRPNQSTFLKKDGCPFDIRIRITQAGQHLFVKEIKETHSHDLTEKTFEHFPKQRRLTSDEAQDVGSMLNLKANKKLVQQHVESLTGKKVILKDLHNLASQLRPDHRNDFEELVTQMRKIPGSTVDAFTDSDEILQGIAFQTKEMQETFEAYPGLLLIDATYKLNDLRMPLYVLMNADGNGESEVIGLWLVATEDRQTLSFLVDKFKVRNHAWERISVIMADKDMLERDVDILICLFHVMKSFRREVVMDKLGTSSGEIDMSLEYLTKMAYARSETEYQGIYAEFSRSVPQSVLTYYNKNWHDIREQWVEGLKNATANFLNKTNNRLESTNQKIKQVVSKYSGMTVFSRT